MSIWDHMKPATTPVAPTAVEVDPTGQLRVDWDQGTHLLPALTLRLNCPCAGCVDEWTHERTLKPESVPADISVRESKAMGNYAVQLAFSDGHQTGIFTWVLLRQLGQSRPSGA